MKQRDGVATRVSRQPLPQRVLAANAGEADLNQGDTQKRRTEKSFSVAAEYGLAQQDRERHTVDDMAKWRRAGQQQGKQQRDQNETGLDGAFALGRDNTLPETADHQRQQQQWNEMRQAGGQPVV
jgi:hypothetical protein